MGDGKTFHIRPALSFLWALAFTTTGPWGMALGSVHHPSTRTLRQGDLQLSLEFRQETSLGTFNGKGHRDPFKGEEDYQRLEYQAILLHGPSDRLEWRGGVRYRENKSILEMGDKAEGKGLESAMLGLRYNLFSHAQFSLGGDLEVRKLLSRSVSLDSPQKEIQLGDEGEFFRLGAILALSLGKNFSLGAQGGVVLPGQNQSIESDFDLSLFWNRGRLSVGLGLDGIFSYGQDDFTDRPSEKPRERVGPTLTLKSINRSYYRGYGALHLDLTPNLWGEFRGGQVLGGEFWDEQHFLQFRLLYRWAGDRDQRVVQRFKQYDVEADVVKVSPQGSLIQINQGLSGHVTKGMRFDIYRVDFLERNILIASGRVFAVKIDRAVIKILKVFKEDAKIKAGYVAKGIR